MTEFENLKHMITRRMLYLVVAMSVATCFASCSGKTAFQESIPIPDAGWQAEKPAEFSFTTADTTSLHQMYLTIRNTTDYPYSNLYLFLDIEFPDDRAYRDTIECILAGRDGKWTGKGFGKMRSQAFMFRDEVWFPVAGTYTFRLQHGMREDSLTGIADAGIRIDRK